MMKCISLLQPWASLVVIGAKQFETRSWRTDYRGPLLIHASKRFWREDKERAISEPFRSALWPVGRVNAGLLPVGAIIGQVDLVDCLSIQYGRSRILPNGSIVPVRPCLLRMGSPLEITETEEVFGDYTIGRFAWKLETPVRFRTPIPWRGQLGLYDVRPEYIREQARAVLAAGDPASTTKERYGG